MLEILELRVVSEPVSELTSEVEGELVVEMGEEEEEEDVDVVGGDSGEGKDVISIPVEQEEEEERMEEVRAVLDACVLWLV